MRYLKKIVFFFTLALLLLTSAFAQDAIQTDIKSLLNVRIVTTLTNNKLVLWKDALEGGDSGMATISAVTTSTDKTPKALPDDGVFQADATHQSVVLNYSNADGHGNQARRSMGVDSFSVSTPGKIYDKIFLWGMSGNGSTALDFKLIFSDKTTEDCQRTVPDWYNEILTSYLLIF